jgi:hypothetical protein
MSKRKEGKREKEEEAGVLFDLGVMLRKQGGGVRGLWSVDKTQGKQDEQR